MQNKQQKRDPSGNPKILVVSDSTEARERALRACSHLLSETADSGIHWCSPRSLNDPRHAEEMAKNAVVSDMIIFSGTADGDFTPELKLWLEGWLFKRSSREGVIIGLFSSPSGRLREVASLKEMYLRESAHSAGLDYLSHLPTGPRMIPDSLDAYNVRAVQVTSVLDEILQTRIPAPPPLQ